MSEIAKLEKEIDALRLKLAEDKRHCHRVLNPDGTVKEESPEAAAIRQERLDVKFEMRAKQGELAALVSAQEWAELRGMDLAAVEAEMQEHRGEVRKRKARLRKLAEMRHTKLLEAEVADMDPAARARLKKALGA